MVMANCRMMNGLDWRTIGYAEYQTHLAGWNAANAGKTEKMAAPPSPQLQRFMAAHTLQ